MGRVSFEHVVENALGSLVGGGILALLTWVGAAMPLSIAVVAGGVGAGACFVWLSKQRSTQSPPTSSNLIGAPASAARQPATAPTTNRWYLFGTLGAAVLGIFGSLLVKIIEQRHTFEIVSDKPGETARSPPSPVVVLPAPELKPVMFGFQTMCRELAPAAGVQTILDRFGQQAMAGAPVALVRPTTEPVTVAASVGGDADGGVLPVNTRVHVLCMADADFAVIKEEHGSHEGVVERGALREP